MIHNNMYGRVELEPRFISQYTTMLSMNEWHIFCLLVIIAGQVCTSNAWSWVSLSLGPNPGPMVIATKGQVWPKPNQQYFYDGVFSIDAKRFNFNVTGETCSLLTNAISRYQLTLKKTRGYLNRARKTFGRMEKPKNLKDDSAVTLTSLEIKLTSPCEELPYLNMDEQYDLHVGSPDYSNEALLKSDSIWGILRGLETFSQLLYYSENSILANFTSISDFPRFPHRGLHLDTSRHYIPKRIILLMLDGMAINKMNVFHWHLVDDQSFPYESQAYPQLSAQGAYSPFHVYKKQDVAEIIEYARLRGIRVIPEFDTPGHTRSWGIAYPELLTPCFDGTVPDGSLGPMHPLRNTTYEFMSTLLEELVEVFPDKTIHLGGDEVPFDCWESNPEISDYLLKNNMTAEKLEEIYIQRIIDKTDSLNATSIVWQEVFDNGVRLPQSTVVHVWRDWQNPLGEMETVTRAGYSALLSACWYLDHLTSGGDWATFYNCDPTDFPGSAEAHKRVLGGEACMWAEVTDATNVVTRVWPRAAAVAEKLWSAPYSDTATSAAARLEEHACRMNMRGVPSQPPNGPGFCPFQLYS